MPAERPPTPRQRSRRRDRADRRRRRSSTERAGRWRAAARARRCRGTPRRAPSPGRVNVSRASIWPTISACWITPGESGDSGVATMSNQSCALTPINTMSPAKIRGVEAGLEQLPGRNADARILAGEMNAEIAARPGRGDGVAVLQGDHAGMGAEAGLAARVGGLDRVARRALRDPQRLHGEARRQPVVVAQNQRHAPHHAVVVGQPVEKADPGGGVGEGRQRRQRAAKRIGEARWDRRRRRRSPPSPAAARRCPRW